MTERLFQASSLRMLAGPLVFFVLISLLWSAKPDSLIAGIGLTLGLIILLRTLYITVTRGAETFSINHGGFSVSRWDEMVPWNRVQKIMTYPTPLNKYILFYLVDSVVITQNRSWPSGLLGRLNSAAGNGEIWVSTSIYPDEHEDMLSAVFDAYSAAVPNVIRTEKECLGEL